VADIIAEDQISTAVQLAEQAAQAEYDAALAAHIAGRADATAEQRKAAADAVARAEHARVAASEAAELAMRPVTGAPAMMSRATASARCTGPDCIAATTGRTAGVPGGSHTAAICAAAASGCAVISDASAATGRDSGELDAGGTPIPGTFGSGQTSSFAVCPDVGCTATLSGAPPQATEPRAAAPLLATLHAPVPPRA
jgi:hypothetical protein